MVLNGVSRTAVLTLRARADEQSRKDRALVDPKAVEWMQKTAWPEELDAWYTPRVQSMLALRALEIDETVATWAKGVQIPSFVELGCGLSTRFFRMRAAGVLPTSWIDLDLPEVVAQRTAIDNWAEMGAGVHSHSAASVLDRDWMDALAGVDPSRLCLIAEGLLYYLPREEVTSLLIDLKDRFPGAVIVFDILGAYDFKNTQKNARSAGTDVLWMIDPPFERVYEDFGLDVVPGFDPTRMMAKALDLYWSRSSWLEQWMVKKLAGVKSLAAKRSGIVVGRLGEPLDLT